MLDLLAPAVLGTWHVVSEIASEMLLNLPSRSRAASEWTQKGSGSPSKQIAFCRLVIGIRTFPNSPDIVTEYNQRAAATCPGLIY